MLNNRKFQDKDIEVILGNSNSNFSGVTSTMLQTFPIQLEYMNIVVMGAPHVDNSQYVLSFLKVAKLCRKALPNNKKRIFHARRNNEMIQALILKYVFFAKIKILFTSTAQRHHSKFTRFLMSKMDAVISTCTNAANYLKTPPKAIIAHGIQTKRFLPIDNKMEVRNLFSINTDYCVGIFGRVRSQKGVDLFVNAQLEFLKKHENVSALICGAILPNEQIFVEKLKQKVERAGLTQRIVFIGEQPFDSIPKIMASMDLNCALSINEGFGLTVLESMASKVPVIATDAGAWKDIIMDSINGFVIDVGSKAQLVEKLNWCFDDSSRLSQMGEHARNHILENYKVEHEAKKLCDCYRSLNEVEE